MSNNQEMDFKSAHKFSSWHRIEILESESCGSFHCKKIFTPDKIHEWVDEDKSDIWTHSSLSYITFIFMNGSMKIKVI